MVYHHLHQCPEASPISIPATTQVKARKLRGGGDDCPPKNTEDMIIICIYIYIYHFPTKTGPTQCPPKPSNPRLLDVFHAGTARAGGKHLAEVI